MPFSSMSFPDENLDRVGRTTTASFASLPPWRCLGCSWPWWSIALLGEDPLLRLPSLSLLCIVQVALVVCWRMLCRCVALADALPPCHLASILFGRMLCRRCWSVGWMLCHFDCVADLRTFGGVVSFSRSSCWLALGWFGLYGWRCSPPSCFRCWLFVVVFGCLFVFFQFFLFF